MGPIGEEVFSPLPPNQTGVQLGNNVGDFPCVINKIMLLKGFSNDFNLMGVVSH